MGEIEVTVNLTIDEVNIILSGLGKLPAEVSWSLITKVKGIAEDQVAKQQPKEE